MLDASLLASLHAHLPTLALCLFAVCAALARLCVRAPRPRLDSMLHFFSRAHVHVACGAHAAQPPVSIKIMIAILEVVIGL